MNDPTTTEDLITEAESLPADPVQLMSIEEERALYERRSDTFDTPEYDQDGNPIWSEA